MWVSSSFIIITIITIVFVSRQTSNTNVNISDRLSLRRKNSNTNVQSSKEILLQGQVNELKEKLKNLEKNNKSEVHHILNQNKENDLERQKKTSSQPRT